MLKHAYCNKLGKLASITNLAPVGKINFLQYLATARKAVTEKTIKSAWQHTSNWPVSRQKALNHPEIRPDKEKRVAEAMAVDEDDPIDRQFIIAMSRESPYQRYKFRRLADEFDTL